MKKSTILIIFFAFWFSTSPAQVMNCQSDLDFLFQKIHNDYPGFNDKITAENVVELKILESRFQQNISKFPDSCYFYLRKYAEFFKDSHLRVRMVGQNSLELTKSPISTYGENIDVEKINLKEFSSATNSIEGLWKSWRGNILVLKSPKNNSYLGVALEYSNWDKGQVIYEFKQQNDSILNIIIHSNFQGRKSKTGIASLHLSCRFLEIHDETFFIRATNSEVYDLASMHTYMPKYPNGINTYFVATILSDSTFYIRIPSFMGYKDKIETTFKKYSDEIQRRPNMIIDIRNNGGGLDEEYQKLYEIIYTNPSEGKGVEWYATKGNIKIFEDAIKAGEIRNGEEGIQWTKELITEMKRNIGGFVVHPFNKKSNESVNKNDTIYLYPRKVGIIINERNASSAEQFLLAARNSKKVTLFGDRPTAGVLDYSNAVSVNFPSGKYKLTIPMTRSTRLPENPIDNIGIKPDIIIPFPPTVQLFDNLDIWVIFVKNYLELQK